MSNYIKIENDEIKSLDLRFCDECEDRFVDETGRAGCIRDKELYQNAARVLKEQGLDLNTAIEEFLKGIVKK